MQEELLELDFDKGNGALFDMEHEGRRMRFFVSQDNAFFVKKASPGRSFHRLPLLLLKFEPAHRVENRE